MKTCIFCNLSGRILYENNLVIATYDKYPATKGHTLIITKRHIETFFDTTEEEKYDMLKAIFVIKTSLDDLYKPDGYNIGTNCGKAAGQTVMHFHMHVLPRYKDDVTNPRGGVRNIIPGKGDYLKK